MKHPTSACAADPESSDCLAEVVEEIVQRLQRGEFVDWKAYCERYPEYALQLQELLPAMQALVDLTALDLPPTESGSARAIPPATSRNLGDFQLLHEIGRGGMGIVYEAEQMSLGRRVALKVLPMAGLLDPRQLQRFKNEARAAASLNHPHIVPVYSVGTENAVHFYSMQLIRGQTLAGCLRQIAKPHEFSLTRENMREISVVPGRDPEPSPTSDAINSLSSGDLPAANVDTANLVASLTQGTLRANGYVRKIAEIGSQIADALDYAHSVGIVHRDIKPSNLLIDEQGKVWIADFGLAQLERETGITMTGDLLGTLRYMSPEQALGQKGQVDGRTDIYSLGITLYELLAARPAFSGNNRQLLLRQVIEQEPPLLHQLNPSVPRDLETIILKAINKDALQRYPTAQAMAEDLRRFLNLQPILAMRPTLWDRSNKWLRRHPALVTSSMLVLLTMAIAMSISTLLISAAYEKEADQRRIAESEATLANAVKEFLRHDVLHLADPATQLQVASGVRYSADLSLREVVLRASEKIENQFPDQPKVEFEIRISIAFALIGMGEDAKAIPHLERLAELSQTVFGSDHLESVEARNRLVFGYFQLERYADAHRLAEKCLAIAKEKLGQEHESTLLAQSNAGVIKYQLGRNDEALAALEPLLPLLQKALGPNAPITLTCQSNLALVYEELGRIEDAGKLYEHCYAICGEEFEQGHPESLEHFYRLGRHYLHVGRLEEATEMLTMVVALTQEKLGQDHPLSLRAACDLGVAYDQSQRQIEAIAFLEPLLSRATEKFGKSHSCTLNCLEILADNYTGLLQHRKSLPLLEQGWKIAETKYGPKHQWTLRLVSKLACTYTAVGQPERALELSVDGLQVAERSLGPEHFITSDIMYRLSYTYYELSQLDKALPLIEQSLDFSEKRFGPNHPSTLARLASLANVYQKLGQPDRALAIHQEILGRNQARFGAEHSATFQAMKRLATHYLDNGELNRALPMLEQASQGLETALGRNHFATLMASGDLARVYEKSGKLRDGMPLQERVVQGLKAQFGPDHPATLYYTNELSFCYFKSGQHEKLLPILEELLEHGQTTLGGEHPITANARRNLAMIYLNDRRFGDAIPLLEKVQATNLNQHGPNHPETIETGFGLAAAYLGNGDPEKAMPLFETVLEQCRVLHGADHPETLNWMNEFGVACWRARQLDRSVPMFEELLRIHDSKLGRQHPDTQNAVFNLGINYKHAGRLEEAIALLEEVVANGDGIGKLKQSRQALLELYVKSQRIEPFRKLAQEEISSARIDLEDGSLPLANLLVAIADQHLQLGLYDEAVPLLREGLQIRQREATDTWNFYNTQSLLGAALLGQAKLLKDTEHKKPMLEEAERMMVSGYEGMNQRESTIPPLGKFRLSESIDRLIELFTILGKTEELEAYRQVRGNYPPASELKEPY